MILVYVDDILITGSNPSHIQTCITQLQQAFSIKDLGQLSYFLGIEVSHTPHGSHFSQTKYLNDLLNRTNMHSAKPCSTPMATGSSLSSDDSALFDNPQ